jgi:hypothetical protein
MAFGGRLEERWGDRLVQLSLGQVEVGARESNRYSRRILVATTQNLRFMAFPPEDSKQFFVFL